MGPFALVFTQKGSLIRTEVTQTQCISTFYSYFVLLVEFWTG